MSDEYRYEFDVTMTCKGCSGAVERVLKKLQENETKVKSYTVSLDPKIVNVTTDDESPLLYQKILQTIKKTGKAVNRPYKKFKDDVYVGNVDDEGKDE